MIEGLVNNYNLDRLKEHVDRELKISEESCVDETQRKVQQALNGQIKEIMEVFYKHRIDGVVLDYVIAVLDRLLHETPIGELQGTDDEWIPCPMFDGMKQQEYMNIRCKGVYKNEKGNAYTVIDGRRKPIKFPYSVV